MAEFHLERVTVGFKSSEANEVKSLMKALKSGKGKGVEEVLAYVQKMQAWGSKIDYAKKSVSIVTEDTDVSAFFPLILAYPRINFGFDFEFRGAAAGGYAPPDTGVISAELCLEAVKHSLRAAEYTCRSICGRWKSCLPRRDMALLCISRKSIKPSRCVLPR
jgi:hypothetical protein